MLSSIGRFGPICRITSQQQVQEEILKKFWLGWLQRERSHLGVTGDWKVVGAKSTKTKRTAFGNYFCKYEKRDYQEKAATTSSKPSYLLCAFWITVGNAFCWRHNQTSTLSGYWQSTTTVCCEESFNDFHHIWACLLKCFCRIARTDITRYTISFFLYFAELFKFVKRFFVSPQGICFL